MKKWPDFKGYICCQDDCLMNFWNYTRLDKNKIWFHQYWTSSLATIQHPWWPWWNYPCGHEALMQTYAKLPSSALKQLEMNCGSQAFAFSWGDFIYIPGTYRKKFIKLSKCFENPDVFIEMALPSILLSLESYDKMEHLNPCWGGTATSVSLDTYDSQVDWIHPVKFSSQLNRTFMRNLLLGIFNKS